MKKDPEFKKQVEASNQFLEYLPQKELPFLNLEMLNPNDWNVE